MRDSRDNNLDGLPFKRNAEGVMVEIVTYDSLFAVLIKL
jgi:hypothetical protein